MKFLRARQLPLSVAGIALLAALLRIPFLNYPATIDDGGFYLVAQSWLRGGSNLYGEYWVDRPPGLIGLFAIAAGTGHFIVIRIIAMLAATIVIVAVARIVHVLGGSALWAATVAACFTLTPLFGAELDPGELLASSVAALAFLAAVEARRTSGRAALALATTAGFLGVAAACVKQDFVDGIVTVAILFAVDWFVAAGERRRPALLLIAGAVGVVIGGLVLLLVSTVAMPGPGALFNAVVTFRIDAGPVLAHSPGARLSQRLGYLGKRAVYSGLLTLLLALFVVAARRFRTASAPGIAVAAGIAISVIGIVGGGGGWNHYLIGPTVWVAIGAGLLSRSILTKVAVGIIAFSCVLTVVHQYPTGPTKAWRHAKAVGLAINRASQPDDTAVVLYGVADVQFYTGLTSPYQYLWSLPTWVRDPKLRQLRDVVAGPDAPTWIVQTNGNVFRKNPHKVDLGALVAQRYRVVSNPCGNHIWLLNGQDRPIPPKFSCRAS